jgi:hypothetical protein
MRRGLDRRDARCAFDCRGVEARRFPQRYREDGAPSVDHVMGKEERDVKPGFLHRDALDAPGSRRPPEIEEGSNPTLPHRLIAADRGPGAGLPPLGRRHGELAYLLLHGHQGEERIGEAGGRC